MTNHRKYKLTLYDVVRDLKNEVKHAERRRDCVETRLEKVYDEIKLLENAVKHIKRIIFSAETKLEKEPDARLSELLAEIKIKTDRLLTSVETAPNKKLSELLAETDNRRWRSVQERVDIWCVKVEVKIDGLLASVEPAIEHVNSNQLHWRQ